MTILKGKLHRIITEDTNRQGILETANRYFTGYTVRPGIGYWEGKAEKSLTLEIITNEAGKVKRLANDIKLLNKQEAVLVEVLSNHASLI